MVKFLARDSGRNCLYFYPQGYLDETQKRGLATVLYLAIAPAPPCCSANCWAKQPHCNPTSRRPVYAGRLFLLGADGHFPATALYCWQNRERRFCLCKTTVGPPWAAALSPMSWRRRWQTLYSVANRTQAKAEAFAEKYGIEKVYDQIDDVFADPDVDIIYISTPHNTHIQYLRKALAAGKHVLCEKSITLNSDELDEAIRLAEEHHVVLAEAMTLYHMPIYRKLQEKLDTGALGELRLIQMNFGSYKPYDMSNRFFNRNLAGGALLDIGVYALSFVRWFMASAPDEVVSQVRFAPTGVDEQAGILLKNKEQEMASVILSLHAKQPKRGTVAFDKGYVEFYDYPRGQEAVITYTEDGSKETLRGGSTADALLYEVEDMERTIAGQGTMHLDYTRDVMRIMTDIRRQWGMTYPEEE